MEVIAKTGRTWSIRADQSKYCFFYIRYVLQIITLSPACHALSVTSKGSLSHTRLYCNLFPSRDPLTLWDWFPCCIPHSFIELKTISDGLDWRSMRSSPVWLIHGLSGLITVPSTTTRRACWGEEAWSKMQTDEWGDSLKRWKHC